MATFEPGATEFVWLTGRRPSAIRWGTMNPNGRHKREHQFNIRIDSVDFEWVTSKANRVGLTRADIIRMLIREAREHETSEPPHKVPGNKIKYKPR